MGLLAIFQAIVNSFLNPNSFVLNVQNWLSAYTLDYNQAKTIAKTVFFYNAVVVGNPIVNFLVNGQNPASEHFMISAIKMYDGANAVLLSTNWALGVSDSLGKQGQLTINNAGTNEIINLPFTQFIPATNDSSSGLFILEKPIVWKAQTNLNIQAFFTTAVVTATYNMRIELIGIKMV